MTRISAQNGNKLLTVRLFWDGYFLIVNGNALTGKKVYFSEVFMGQ